MVLVCAALVGCAGDEPSSDDDGSSGGSSSSTSIGGSGAGTSVGGSGGSGGSSTGGGGGLPVDECADMTHNCDVNATCTDLPDGFECTCNPGFTGDGTTCTDDDECADMTHTCDVNATCTNTPGGYTCTCNSGYSGNGMTCTDDDECALMTHSCDANATCTNTEGGYTCTCNSGYSGNGMTCTDDNECALMTHTCDANATCTNTPGSYTCACNSGYSGNGMTCTDDDECALMTHSCDANATCANTPGSYTCTCNPPYIGNGMTCMLPPVGDLCSDPKVVASLPYTDSDDTSLFHHFYETGGGCPTDGGDYGLDAPETVYAFTPTSSGVYAIQITKTYESGPSLVYVTTNCADIVNTCAFDSDDIYYETEATIPMSLTAGTTYYIMLDGYFELEAGPYTIDIVEAQPEVCTDTIDNDFDGDADCDDSDCDADPACFRLEQLTGCDPTYCTFTAAAGPNGGDLCSCTVPPALHPDNNDFTQSSACMYFGDGYDLVMSFDVTAYSAFSLSTCGTPGDSSLAVFDADPSSAPAELYCSTDASGESSYCSEIGDSGGSGPPLPTPKPGNTLWVLVDEYFSGSYWDGVASRTIDVELIP